MIFDCPAPASAGAVHHPGPDVVAQMHVDRLGDHAPLQLRVAHPECDLEALEQVASHPVGRGEPDVHVAAVQEAEHAAVLEEADHHRSWRQSTSARRAAREDDADFFGVLQPPAAQLPVRLAGLLAPGLQRLPACMPDSDRPAAALLLLL